MPWLEWRVSLLYAGCHVILPCVQIKQKFTFVRRDVQVVFKVKGSMQQQTEAISKRIHAHFCIFCCLGCAHCVHHANLELPLHPSLCWTHDSSASDSQEVRLRFISPPCSAEILINQWLYTEENLCFMSAYLSYLSVTFIPTFS